MFTSAECPKPLLANPKIYKLFIDTQRPCQGKLLIVLCASGTVRMSDHFNHETMGCFQLFGNRNEQFAGVSGEAGRVRPKMDDIQMN